MPSWVEGLQGIREILNAAGSVLTRRQQMQFTTGLQATDDGSKTVITADGPTLVAQSGVAAAVAAAVRGQRLAVSGSTLDVINRPRYWQFDDWFFTGGDTDGQIGALNWRLFVSNSGAASREAGAGTISSAHKLTLTTDANTNDYVAVTPGSLTNANICALPDVDILQCAVRINVTSQVKIFFGFQDNVSADPTTDSASLGLLFDSGTNFWQTGSRNSSVGSYSVTAAPVTVSTSYLLSLVRNGSTWDAYVDNSLAGSMASNIPSGFHTFGLRVQTKAAAAASVSTGYFGGRGALVGVLSTDDFLEA